MSKGCSLAPTFQPRSSTIPAAAKKPGTLHIGNSVVHSLDYDESSQRVKGVRVYHNDDLSERELLWQRLYFLSVLRPWQHPDHRSPQSRKRGGPFFFFPLEWGFFF